MNFLEHLFTSKKRTHRFRSILIITYGRSGSTLLQGVLNSIDGVVVRGENNNMCYHMFKTYTSILKSKAQRGEFEHNPFYGSELLDEEYFLAQTRNTVKQLLIGDQNQETGVSHYGFKEIRYIDIQNDFLEYLTFLEKIFPDPCFVFNTRNKHDVFKSWVNVGWSKQKDEEKALKRLTKLEALFLKARKARKNNAFHITYEEVIQKSGALKALIEFIGLPYDDGKIEDVLSLRHSYKPAQPEIKTLPYTPPTSKNK